MSNEVPANGISVCGNIGGRAINLKFYSSSVLSKSCFLLQALNCMVLVSDFRKKRRKGERKVLVLQMPKGIRGEKTRVK